MTETSGLTTTLGDVLVRSSETSDRQPHGQFQEVTVKLWGKGVVKRRTVTATQIGGSRRFVARAGQFILSRIDARNGAMGIVPPELDGALVTNDFPLFKIREDHLLPEYLGWWCRSSTFVERCRQASEGTTNRVRLKEEKFLAMAIKLPPLALQRRLVAEINSVAGAIDEACALRSRATAETELLMASHLGVTFTDLANRCPVKPLGDLTSDIVDGPHQTPNYLPAGTVGVPFVTVKNMVSGTLDLRNLNYISADDHRAFTRRRKAEYGDVLYSKDGATRGRPCFVDTQQEFSYFVSVALIKPVRSVLDGRYLVHLLNSTWIKDRMIDKSRGDMIPHIVLREIRAFPVPLPPLREQRSIVEDLDRIQFEIAKLKQFQAASSAELQALLPAVLARSFNGQ